MFSPRFASAYEEAYGSLALQPVSLPAEDKEFVWLVITAVDQASEAFTKGLVEGDIITEAGQQKVARLQDLEDRTGLRIPTSETMDWDLGSISEAARQLEETRLLGQQFLWLVSRLPTALGWEAQGAIYLANAQDTLLSVDHGLAEVSSGLAGTSQHLNDVADRMDKLGIGVRGLHQGLTGSEGLRGIVRETLVTGGLVMAVLIVLGTFCALLVVRRLREPRK